MRFPTMWYVRLAEAQTSLRISQSDQSLCYWLEYSMSVNLLAEQEAAQARLSLFMSKCHIMENLMLWLIWCSQIFWFL